ncbi:GNAT family N-acetyltransferase [Metabacillus sp. GX 13764]|uniref:GNAT family N-acetyltransferase n=1 Tax=Metabacillus kandeliae TaxID=2900151 RepID=UPI001E2F0294|nr:GNAT family N-acetyltransferase [Metabacillus kandeliae]MCD7033976.1 GNAT family N-acetyltransferase [Metabacillus kandeliae]
MYKNKAALSWEREDGFLLSTDKSLLNLNLIHSFLSEDSYWAKGIAKELVHASVENAQLCWGVHKINSRREIISQVGFARVVTDFVRFSYLSDVFILPEYRGKELGKWLVSVIVSHPKLKGPSFQLTTNDAQGLYSQFGFQPLKEPARKMERPKNMKDIYNAYQLVYPE